MLNSLLMEIFCFFISWQKGVCSIIYCVLQYFEGNLIVIEYFFD